MKFTLTLACLALAACGGGGDSYTTNETTVLPASPVIEVSPTTGGMQQPAPTLETVPPVVLVPAPCAKPDPQPTHGHDPACHGG